MLIREDKNQDQDHEVIFIQAERPIDPSAVIKLSLKSDLTEIVETIWFTRDLTKHLQSRFTIGYGSWCESCQIIITFNVITIIELRLLPDADLAPGIYRPLYNLVSSFQSILELRMHLNFTQIPTYPSKQRSGNEQSTSD